MQGLQAALRILSQELDRSDGTEGVDAALDALRKLPMTNEERLNKTRRTRAITVKGRDSQMSRENLERYNRSIVRKRENEKASVGR